MELSRLKLLCQSLKAKREAIQALDEQKKELNKQLEKEKQEVLEHLKASDLKNFDFGEGKVIAVDKFNVSVADKYALADHLKTLGRFDDLYTFNYNSINSYYKEEMENAISKGDMDFQIPGLSEPKYYQMLQIRSK